jgi:DNA-binding NarL/FixJ family response regulator
MPDVSGLELLPPLRTRLPDAFLIALSLRDPEAYRAQTLAAGADAFVAKARLECDLLPTSQRLAARQPQRGMTPQGGVTHGPDPDRGR